MTKPDSNLDKGRNSKKHGTHEASFEQARNASGSRPNLTNPAREFLKTGVGLDWLTADGLVAHTGHAVDDWPIVILKELVDNGLDGADDAGIPPEISIKADATGITVRDNGPGMNSEAIETACDFSVRGSTKALVRSPDRGAQGHAMKTLLGMSHICDPELGRIVITTRGQEHSLCCRADLVHQCPTVDRQTKCAKRTVGTTARIGWSRRNDNQGKAAWPFEEVPLEYNDYWDADHCVRERFVQQVRSFSCFNPHARFVLDWFGQRLLDLPARDTAWRKWKADNASSVWWYDVESLGRLAAACVARDRDVDADRTVADFLTKFDGLAGSAKRREVIERCGMTRVKLSVLVDDGRVRDDLVTKLLAAMKSETKAVSPKRLGVIGKANIAGALHDQFGVDVDHVEYASVTDLDDGIPYVLESAFVFLGDDAPERRHLLLGVNWSASIGNPFRQFGNSGRGLDGLLSDNHVARTDPVVLVLHAVHPALQFADRGKTSIIMRDVQGGNADDD
jgi:hypothetical protein